MIDPQISISMSDLQGLQKKITDLQNAADILRQENEELKTRTSSEITETLYDGLKKAFSVIRFCVSHLDPEFIRGWPHEDLKIFGEAIKSMAPLAESTQDKHLFLEMGAEFQTYAADVVAMREKRGCRDLANESLGSGTTLTVVFPDESSRKEFMESHGLWIPESGLKQFAVIGLNEAPY